MGPFSHAKFDRDGRRCGDYGMLPVLRRLGVAYRLYRLLVSRPSGLLTMRLYDPSSILSVPSRRNFRCSPRCPDSSLSDLPLCYPSAFLVGGKQGYGRLISSGVASFDHSFAIEQSARRRLTTVKYDRSVSSSPVRRHGSPVGVVAASPGADGPPRMLCRLDDVGTVFQSTPPATSLAGGRPFCRPTDSDGQRIVGGSVQNGLRRDRREERKGIFIRRLFVFFCLDWYEP